MEGMERTGQDQGRDQDEILALPVSLPSRTGLLIFFNIPLPHLTSLSASSPDQFVPGLKYFFNCLPSTEARKLTA